MYKFYIYVHAIHIHTYIYIYTYVDVHIHIYILACLHVNVYVCIFKCISVLPDTIAILAIWEHCTGHCLRRAPLNCHVCVQHLPRMCRIDGVEH